MSDTAVSIHAPAWGATACRTAEQEGKDVSIHAPAWGATNTISHSCETDQRFNPRARVGRDFSATLISRPVACFNPRARVGRDLRIPSRSQRSFCFNPRARVGRDS